MSDAIWSDFPAWVSGVGQLSQGREWYLIGHDRYAPPHTPDDVRFFKKAVYPTRDNVVNFEPKPPVPITSPEWPDESRIDIVATNGNTGEHYEATELATAADFLSAGLEILSQRGEQYGNDGRECSFPQAAEAFNAITGHNLKGSDVCLILALVKQVRQYAQPGRFHEDSAVDGVNYLALQSELLKKERV